jgi:hypothetical protein
VRFHIAQVLSETLAAAGEIFGEFFVAVREHVIAYCWCRGRKATYIPAVTARPHRRLQQSEELHFSLTDIDGEFTL